MKLLRRFWMNVKLARGRCENCGGILPDVRPIPNYRACSEACADEIWTAQTS